MVRRVLPYHWQALRTQASPNESTPMRAGLPARAAGHECNCVSILGDALQEMTANTKGGMQAPQAMLQAEACET